MRLFTLPLLAVCFGAWVIGEEDDKIVDNQTVPLTPTPLIEPQLREPRWGIFFSYEKACTRACVKNGKFGGRMIGGVCRCWCVRNEQAPCKGAYPSCNRVCKLNFYPMGGDCVDGIYCYCTCGVRQPQSPNATLTTTPACPGSGGGGGGSQTGVSSGDNSAQTIGNTPSMAPGTGGAVQGPPPASQGPFVSNPTGTGPGSGGPDSSSGANTPGGPFTNQSPGVSSGEGAGGGGGGGGTGGGSNQNQGGGDTGGPGSSGGPAAAGGGDGGSVSPGASAGTGGGPPAKIDDGSEISSFEALKQEYYRLKALVPKYLGKQQKRSITKA